MKRLPLFYFPPTIAWVDDDELFLQAACNLFSNHHTCLRFSDPEIALNFIKSYQAPTANIEFTRALIENDDFDTPNNIPIDINISEIFNLAKTDILKNELAILIVDNNMPNINGIQLCTASKNKAFKKILLTGQTTLQDAVNIFNDGLIDKFIEKNLNISEKLIQTISELSYQYFYEKTKPLLNHIETHTLSPLSDPIFIDFFYQWIKKNNFSEFYLINKNGSFFAKNNNQHGYMIIMNESEKNKFIDLNDDADHEIQNLLDNLKQGKTIPFFGVGKNYWEFDYSNWKNFLYPANTLDGREKYYWTSIITSGENQ